MKDDVKLPDIGAIMRSRRTISKDVAYYQSVGECITPRDTEELAQFLIDYKDLEIHVSRSEDREVMFFTARVYEKEPWHEWKARIAEMEAREFARYVELKAKYEKN